MDSDDSSFTKKNKNVLEDTVEVEVSEPLTLYKYGNKFILKGTIPYGEKKTMIGQKELCIGNSDETVYFTILECNMIYIQLLDVDCCGFPDYTEYEVIALWSHKLKGWCFHLRRLGDIKMLIRAINRMEH